MLRIEDRLTGLADAVASIPDGATVALGGFLHHRHPMAVVRELVRQERSGLRLIAPIGGIDADMLIAADAVDRITFGFISLEAVGTAPAFMAKTAAGELEIDEYGDRCLVRSLQATDMRVPWVPVRAWLGSDMEDHHPGQRRRLDEAGEEFWTTPAIDVEYGVLHASYATPEGSFLIWGEGYDRLIANAADKILVSAERIVSPRELHETAKRISNGAPISPGGTTWVVEAPLGAHPGSCYPFYNGDLEHELEYFERVSASEWDTYSDEYLGADEDEYLDRIGSGRIESLESRMKLAIRLGNRLAESGPEALA